MQYKQLQSNMYSTILGEEVQKYSSVYGSSIVESAEGRVYIDGVATNYASLEEAEDQIRQQKIQEDIQSEIRLEQISEMSHDKMAAIIKSHHSSVRVTDTLIESYVELTSSKIFTLDPVVAEMREYNKLGSLVEGKLDFKLDDGTVVAINEDTLTMINNIFEGHSDVVQYMRQSLDNFVSVVEQIEN